MVRLRAVLERTLALLKEETCLPGIQILATGQLNKAPLVQRKDSPINYSWENERCPHD